MGQNLDNKHKELLWDLLANPADNGHLHNQDLEQLVRDNPQSGLLQVLFARSGAEPDYGRAATYFDSRALYKLVNQPDTLAPVSLKNIIRTLDGELAQPERNTPEEVEAHAQPEIISDEPVAAEESLVVVEEQPEVVLHEAELAEPPKLLEQEYEHQEGEIVNQFTETPVAPTERNWWDEPLTPPQPADAPANWWQQTPKRDEAPAIEDAANNELPPLSLNEEPAQEEASSVQANAGQAANDSPKNWWEQSDGTPAPHATRNWWEEPATAEPATMEDGQSPRFSEDVVTVIPSSEEPHADLAQKDIVAEDTQQPVQEVVHMPGDHQQVETSASYKQPTDAPVAESLPQNATGEQEETAAPKDFPAVNYPTEDLYEAYFAEQKPVDSDVSQWEEGLAADTDIEEAAASSDSGLSPYTPFTENVFHRQDAEPEEIEETPRSIDAVSMAAFGSRFPKPSANKTADALQQEIPTVVPHFEYQEPVQLADVPAENSNDQQVNSPAQPSVEPEQEKVETVIPAEEEKDAEPQTYLQEVKAEEDCLVLGNIVGADYLAIDRKLDELSRDNNSTGQQQEPSPEIPASAQVNSVPAENAPADKQNVSKYDDDTMPYSFMWWLDKTRKEYANTRPYASAQPAAKAKQAKGPQAAPPKPQMPRKLATDDLQQQYYENIFSLTSVSSIAATEETPQVEFDHSKKEDVIIERFIHTDPQIKPLSADKLDSENKAKKSSEDQDAMVTETLARIYADQMLYHKAIATYKKLVLKYPEKNLYFAGQIEQLEKKIN